MWAVCLGGFATQLFAVTEDNGRPETGAYRVSMGLFQPTFSEADNYEDFYNSPGMGTMIMVEHFPWEYAVTLGYSFHVGYYQDSGHAAIASGSELATDDTTQTDFAMLPIQISLNLVATPFPESKWFTLSAWLGFERVIFNETRRSTSSSSSEESENLVYSNFGMKNATVVGGAVNILLKGKDKGSSIDVLGLRRVFLSPYMEIVTSAQKDGLQLGGSRLGLAFSFELNDD